MSETLKPIEDEFRGDNVNLKASIKALIQLGDADALFPNKLGGHARALLAASYHRLDDNRWRSVAEQAEKALEEARDTLILCRLLDRSGQANKSCDKVEEALAAFDSLRKEGQDD